MSDTAGPLQILQSLSDAIAEVAEKVSATVVSVGFGRGGGSGVAWSTDGYIVTSNHVVGGRDAVDVGLGDGRSSEAKVVGRDEFSDIALLKLEGVSLKPIELGDSGKIKVGQFVLALANPLNLRPSATSGIITSAKRSMRAWWVARLKDAIVTDARLNPGYSGGPLVDVLGRMIGLNIAYISSRGIAIPVTTVKSIVDTLKREGRVKRAYLGIISSSIPLPQEIASQPQINQDQGILVLSVEGKRSPARMAGLAMGDVILKFDEKSVVSHYDLLQLLTQEVIGKSVKISILRGEQLTELTVTLGEASD